MRYLLDGKFSAYFLCYVFLGAVEIVLLVLTQFQGRLEGPGLLSDLLALVICFPWVYVLLFLPGSLLEFAQDWVSKPAFLIASVLINAWVVYKMPVWLAGNKGLRRDWGWVPLVGVLVVIMSFNKFTVEFVKGLIHGPSFGVLCVRVINAASHPKVLIDIASHGIAFERKWYEPLGSDARCSNYSLSMSPIQLRAYSLTDANRNARSASKEDVPSVPLAIDITNDKSTCVDVYPSNEASSPVWNSRVVSCGR